MLTGKQIVKEWYNGKIIITPYNKQQLGPNSYDLTIGEFIARPKVPKSFEAIDLTSLIDVSRMFEIEEIDPRFGTIIIPAKSRILCHTQETIGTTDLFVMQLATRSTLARLGLDVCGSAGFGDVGFVSKWTMELSNLNSFDVSIPVGSRVAQAYFTPVVGNSATKYTGVYAGTDWSPTMMLPKVIS